MSSTRSFLKDRPCLFECKREKQRSETGKDFVPLFSSGTVRGLASLGNDRRLHSLKKRLVVEKTGDLGRTSAARKGGEKLADEALHLVLQ